jgi:single-strand DNA-binding protein
MYPTLQQKEASMFHTVIIAGYLGRDPEMRYLPSGTPVTNFSVASNRRWTGQDGQSREETIWFRISAFGRLAETCNQYLSKGRAVLVEGNLRPDDNGNPRTWTGQDGATRASFEVRAQTVRFLGRRDEAAAAEVPEYEGTPTEEEEEIPF